MKNWLGEIVQENITPEDIVLDLGCGIQQANDEIKCKYILGVDIWEVYLNHIKNNIPTCKISMDETDRFMDKSYDVVLCLDVVEHLEYDLALKVLDECKRIARRKVIIYTPNEFKNNDQLPEGAWGLGENKYQKHLCLIEKFDLLSRGYTVDNPMGDGYLAVWV